METRETRNPTGETTTLVAIDETLETRRGSGGVRGFLVEVVSFWLQLLGRWGKDARPGTRSGALESSPGSVSASFLIRADIRRAMSAFASEREMEVVLGLSEGTTNALRAGKVSDPRAAELLRTVAVVVEEARRVFHPAVIRDWLGTPQYELDDRTPIGALREGQLAAVLQAVTATEHGAYS